MFAPRFPKQRSWKSKKKIINFVNIFLNGKSKCAIQGAMSESEKK